jgi:hypothetical protein
MDTFIHYGMAAGIQALRDSGLEVTPGNAERIGVIEQALHATSHQRVDAQRQAGEH